MVCSVSLSTSDVTTVFVCAAAVVSRVLAASSRPPAARRRVPGCAYATSMWVEVLLGAVARPEGCWPYEYDHTPYCTSTAVRTASTLFAARGQQQQQAAAASRAAAGSQARGTCKKQPGIHVFTDIGMTHGASWLTKTAVVTLLRWLHSCVAVPCGTRTHSCTAVARLY
jgi:hypothetical protein